MFFFYCKINIQYFIPLYHINNSQYSFTALVTIIFRLLSISLKTAVGIFQIVNNRGVVIQLFLVKLETCIESLQRMSLNES